MFVSRGQAATVIKSKCFIDLHKSDLDYWTSLGDFLSLSKDFHVVAFLFWLQCADSVRCAEQKQPIENAWFDVYQIYCPLSIGHAHNVATLKRSKEPRGHSARILLRLKTSNLTQIANIMKQSLGKVQQADE